MPCATIQDTVVPHLQPCRRHSRWLAVGEPGTLSSFLRDFLHHLDLESSRSAPASSAAHSWSSGFSRRTSLAPAVDRLFADPVPLGHRQHQLAIRLAQDRHYLPSVKRALRIAPSESRARLSRNHWSEIPGPSQRHPAGGSRIGLVTSCVGASLFSSGEICEKPLFFEQQSLRVWHLP